jgi:hypothetical protein
MALSRLARLAISARQREPGHRHCVASACSQRPGELEYTCRYPVGVTHEFARSCFWDAMNDVRRQPYVQRFHVDSVPRLRY